MVRDINIRCACLPVCRTGQCISWAIHTLPCHLVMLDGHCIGQVNLFVGTCDDAPRTRDGYGNYHREISLPPSLREETFHIPSKLMGELFSLFPSSFPHED